MTLRKLIGKIHLWLGLSSGLIVFILAVTGCIYVFEKETKSMVYADRMYVEPAGSPLPLSVLWEKAQAALGEERPIWFAVAYEFLQMDQWGRKKRRTWALEAMTTLA